MSWNVCPKCKSPRITSSGFEYSTDEDDVVIQMITCNRDECGYSWFEKFTYTYSFEDNPDGEGKKIQEPEEW